VRVGDALSTLRSVPPSIDLLYLDGAKTLYRGVLGLCEPSLTSRALVIADNIDMEELVAPYTAYVRSPENGYLSNRVAFAEALEVSLRIAA
jgi:predicted O-methyltransferase YrrM